MVSMVGLELQPYPPSRPQQHAIAVSLFYDQVQQERPSLSMDHSRHSLLLRLTYHRGGPMFSDDPILHKTAHVVRDLRKKSEKSFLCLMKLSVLRGGAYNLEVEFAFTSLLILSISSDVQCASLLCFVHLIGVVGSI
jgi:hypothetical protein